MIRGLGMVEHYQNERSLIEHKALGRNFLVYLAGTLYLSIYLLEERRDLMSSYFSPNFLLFQFQSHFI